MLGIAEDGAYLFQPFCTREIDGNSNRDLDFGSVVSQPISWLAFGHVGDHTVSTRIACLFDVWVTFVTHLEASAR